MKRIDLHIHTLPSNLDEQFDFDEGVLVDHVKNNGLAGIAITNHNLFDRGNYGDVVKLLPDVSVLPGIEVSVRGYHVLVIANPTDLDEFESRCQVVPNIGKDADGIPLAEFQRLFCDKGWFVIPHYKKKPAIDSRDLVILGRDVTALEVSSQKKWAREFEDSAVTQPVVMFSDMRCFEGRGHSAGKYTYVDVSTVEFDTLKLAFLDKAKFAISEKRGTFELAPNLYASLGLNVVIGGRSTGKSYLLSSIYASCDPSDVVYLRQFSIVKNAEEERFKELMEKEIQAIKDSYYEPMHPIAKAMTSLPKKAHVSKRLKDYIDDLKNYADTQSRDDEYSKCPVYSCSQLPSFSSDPEKKLVEAITVLLDENPLSSEIEREIGAETLKRLLAQAIRKYRDKEIKRRSAERTNDIVRMIKRRLADKSSRPICPVSPFEEAARRRGYIKRFARLREFTKEDTEISRETVGRFTRVALRKQYKDAQKMKAAIRAKSNLGGIQKRNALEFTEDLLEAEGTPDLAKSLFTVEVKLKNDKGQDVSGGQRAEYLFMKALKDAASHDIVLIDEPESSFDNPYLNDLIAMTLRALARKSTVFIATHNNVLGVSIKPNGIIYTESGEDGSHDVYSGNATEQLLTNSDDKSVKRADVLMELMEAGKPAYEDRRPYYGFA